MVSDSGLSVTEGLKYPWGNAKRQWNILWGLIPIYGWFALYGYMLRVIRSIVEGDTQGLPEFGSSWDNFVKGLVFVLMLIPIYFVVVLLNFIPFVGGILYFIAAIFFLPFIIIHLVVEDRFAASFDFRTWWDVVVGNLKEYFIAFIKSLVYFVVYGFLSIILVGIPGMFFAGNIFLADFYRRFAR